MPTISKHFLTGLVLSAIYVAVFNTADKLVLLILIFGSIFPDIPSIIYTMIKEKTIKPEKIITSETWKKVYNWDDYIFHFTLGLTITAFITEALNAYLLSFFIAVSVHYLMDLFIHEREGEWL